MRQRQRGMTLLELTVVLLILSALAGLAVPYVMGTGERAMCQTTDATMQAVKEAIMGGKAGPGFYGDLLGQLPKATRFATPDFNLSFLFAAPADASWGSLRQFNPKTAVGWRGPYLQGGSRTPDGLTASFSATSGVSATVHVVITGSQVLDGWGRPLVLQVPDSASCDKLTGLTNTQEAYCARLISAGPDNGPLPGDAEINTPINDDPATTPAIENARQGYDRILYLRIPTPANDSVNQECS